MRRKVSIRVPGPVGSRLGQIQIDDEPMHGVTGFSLTHQANGDLHLSVDLAVNEIEVDGVASVYIMAGARESLIKFGWTPPADDHA